MRAIGVDLGGSTVKAWLGKAGESTLPGSTSAMDEEGVARVLADCVEPAEPSLPVGVALPCTLIGRGAKRSVIGAPSKFAALEGRRIDELAEAWARTLDRRVAVINDAEAAALDALDRGSLTLREGRTLVLVLGTSIGAATMEDGRLCIGPYTSHASHVRLDPEGALCPGTQHRGCWKTLVGVDGRRQLALKLGLSEPPPQSDALDAKRIAEMARRRDPRAELYYRCLAHGLARGLANLLLATPVDSVVIGGGLSRSGHLLEKPLLAELQGGHLLDPCILSVVRITFAPELSCARGAATHAREQSDEG